MTDSNEGFTVWITKYALTQGILRKVVLPTSFPDMVTEKVALYPNTFHEKDWHRKFSDAQERAYEMRSKKIASLKKQIAKIELMRFDLDTK